MVSECCNHHTMEPAEHKLVGEPEDHKLMIRNHGERACSPLYARARRRYNQRDDSRAVSKRWIAFAVSHDEILLCHEATGSLIGVIHLSVFDDAHRPIQSLAFSPEQEDMLVVCTSFGDFVFVDVARCSILAVRSLEHLDKTDWPKANYDWHHHGRFLLTNTPDGQSRLWDLHLFKLIATLAPPRHKSYIIDHYTQRSVCITEHYLVFYAFSEDYRLLVTAFQDHYSPSRYRPSGIHIRVIDVESRMQLREWFFRDAPRHWLDEGFTVFFQSGFNGAVCWSWEGSDDVYWKGRLGGDGDLEKWSKPLPRRTQSNNPGNAAVEATCIAREPSAVPH